MNLAGRVGRIEQAVAPEGGCRVCRGSGPPIYTLMYVEGEPEPPRRPCAGCGKDLGAVKIIILPAEVGEQG